MLQSQTKACSSDTMLTISECITAKVVLDPSAAAVDEEYYAGAPSGCSRTTTKWYFNTHRRGVLDGTSQPVCKAVYGNGTDMNLKFAALFHLCI